MITLKQIERYQKLLRNNSAKPGQRSARFKLLTPEAEAAINSGSLPDLEPLCLELYRTFTYPEAPFNALQFVPVMQFMANLDNVEKSTILNQKGSRHILAENNLIKIVLICWKPGEESSIHGHPAGGCVFKVLHGSLEEKRYTAEPTPQHLSTSSFKEGALGYIDDGIGLHKVANVSHDFAISIHAYTPGIKN